MPNGEYWTKKQDELLLEKVEQGYSFKQISEYFLRSKPHNACYLRYRRLNGNVTETLPKFDCFRGVILLQMLIYDKEYKTIVSCRFKTKIQLKQSMEKIMKEHPIDNINLILTVRFYEKAGIKSAADKFPVSEITRIYHPSEHEKVLKKYA